MATKIGDCFVRIFNRADVNKSIDLLNTVCDEPFEHIPPNTEHFEIKAPDGDVVFAGLRKGDADTFICRLHKEVFAQ